MQFSIKIIFIYFLVVTCKVSTQEELYDENENYEKYSGYGNDWMFFPDGDGNPTVGILKDDGNNQRWSMFFDVEKSVNFTLYTRQNVENGQGLRKDEDIFQNSFYDISKPTKFIIHGWLSSGSSDTCITIKDAYLKHFDYNVIIVDWSEIASNYLYPIPMAYTKSVGTFYAGMVDFVIQLGTDPKHIHLIGHSLGAHISGFAGGFVKTVKIGRVTGLDPAFPGFKTTVFTGGRLSTSNALFVDVIHSCAGILGMPTPLGDVDFYPNGGFPPQPGCEGVAAMVEACSHGRSWQYFKASIDRKIHFVGYSCPTWADYQAGRCKENPVPMGDPTPSNSSGIFYLQTSARQPFALEV